MKQEEFNWMVMIQFSLQISGQKDYECLQESALLSFCLLVGIFDTN